jgi:hypothetical protein
LRENSCTASSSMLASCSDRVHRHCFTQQLFCPSLQPQSIARSCLQ